jgi:hypothetical protein
MGQRSSPRLKPGDSAPVDCVEQVFSRHPEGRFHALGVANARYLKRFPFASADSVWWLCKFRVRQSRLAPGADYRAEKLARIRYLLDLERAPWEGYQLALAD